MPDTILPGVELFALLGDLVVGDVVVHDGQCQQPHRDAGEVRQGDQQVKVG